MVFSGGWAPTDVAWVEAGPYAPELKARFRELFAIMESIDSLLSAPDALRNPAVLARTGKSTVAEGISALKTERAAALAELDSFPVSVPQQTALAATLAANKATDKAARLASTNTAVSTAQTQAAAIDAALTSLATALDGLDGTLKTITGLRIIDADTTARPFTPAALNGAFQAKGLNKWLPAMVASEPKTMAATVAAYIRTT